MDNDVLMNLARTYTNLFDLQCDMIYILNDFHDLELNNYSSISTSQLFSILNNKDYCSNIKTLSTYLNVDQINKLLTR